ncbi:ABC transporter permease [Malacoplasma penetrans]|nr:ABC transporter permease [Malacoplasma penetrans]
MKDLNMLQLIKQVLKSFKSSILLLIGLFFISFAIVFATFSSLYFSNNISSSYSTMESSSKGSQAILETKDDSLKNGTLEYDYDSLNSLQSISSSNGVYFSSLEDYAEIEKSFIYPVTNLYHSSFTKQGSVSNYIFAYYTDTSSNNPYFTGTGINSFDSIYKTRARGILTSYGNLVIPSESTKWRAYGLELGSSDLQYIVYDINPLTGQTNINSSTNRVNTLGYFSNGHLNSTISFSSGNLKYPTNLTANSPSETLDGSKNYQIKNGSTNTPFFISKSDWWTDQSYDLQGSSIDSVLSGFKTVDGTDDQPDIANILSSFYVDSSVSLSLDKEIDWNIASLTPWYDYMRILRDKNYLTNTVTNNSKDFVFSIHLNNDKLTTLQKETLEYVKAKYGIQKYIDLTSFVYTVNSLWIKDAALSYFDSNSTEYNEINKLSFNSLNELALTYGDYSGLSIVKTWLKNYGDDKLITIDKELKQYEKEYLSYQQMSQLSNIEYNVQKSFTLSDFKSYQTFLVSLKGGSYGDNNQTDDINQIVLSDGSSIVNSYDFLSEKYSYLKPESYVDDLQESNSTKYEDISNALLSAEIIGGASQPKLADNGYSINEQGKYLINLIRLIKDTYLSGVQSGDSSTDASKIIPLATKIINQYDGNTEGSVSGTINVNDYYHLFALATPQNYFLYVNSDATDSNSSYLFNNNTQNLVYNFVTRGGLTPLSYLSKAILSAPYGNAIVVNDQWLSSNQKSVIPVSEWNKALLMNSREFEEWKSNLSANYKVTINSLDFIIIGSGTSFENSFPVVSLESPIPNPKTEGAIYVDDIGYNSLLYTNSEVNQDIYFAIKFKNNGKVDLEYVNSRMNKYLDNAYLSSTLKNNTNLLTARISYPRVIAGYVNIFAIILIVVLMVIGIYLSSLLIKIYVEKNRIPLAVAKANGISTWQISLSLSVFGIAAAFISGILGYVVAYFAQGMFLGILNNFWFIPIGEHTFSAIGLIGAIGSLYLAFLLFCVIGVVRTFRNPINELLSSTEELKVNKLLYLIKSRKIPLFALTKFRISLSLSKLTRFILFVILCSAGISIITVGSAIPRKFETSQNSTLSNKQYSYRYNLQTPSEQSGLYKYQEYTDLGITDEERGIFNIYENPMFEWQINPYKTISTSDSQETRDLMALRDLNGNVITYENGKKKYFTNFLLPSYVSINSFTNDIELFRNVIVSKWLIDFDISVAGIYINAWDFVSNAFPTDLISRINAISNNFLVNVLEVPELKAINDSKSYIIQNSSGNWVLDSNSVLDLSNVANTSSIRFNDEFLKFIGMVYGNKQLSSLDAKITFGIVPFRDLSSNDLTETYTYLDAILNDSSVRIPSLRNDGKRRLTNIEQQIYGIKEDSKYVTLVDDENRNLNSLLSQPSEISSDGFETYPVVINQGAAYKYDLEIGESFKIDINNTYTRYTDRMMNKNPVKTIKLKIVGISSDSFQTGMYISQENANQILGLNFSQGATIVGSSNYDVNQKLTTTVLGDWSSGVLATPTSSTDNKYVVIKKSYPTDYVPFNGVFSKEENPLLVNSLLLENTSGLWGNYSSFNDAAFATLVSFVGVKHVLNLVTPYSAKGVAELSAYYGLSTTDKYSLSVAMSNNMTILSLQSWLQSNIGTPSIVAINSFEYFQTLFDTYTTIFRTLLVIETLLICLFVPLIIIIIMIVSSVMMSDFRKLVAILKTLGYSDRENLLSILMIFVPVMLISLIVGIIVIASLSTFFNFMIFNAASIYLSPAIDWVSYLYGVIAIAGIVIINFIFVSVYLKKQNLKNSIS